MSRGRHGDRLRFAAAAVAALVSGAAVGAALGSVLEESPVVRIVRTALVDCPKGRTGAATRAPSGTPGVTGGVLDPTTCEPTDRGISHTDPEQDDQPTARTRGGGPVRTEGREFTRGGERFFWLADTAWSLFVNLDRAETEEYLDVRAEQGFTAVQAVAIFPQAGGPGPNRYGDSPFRSGLDDLAVTPGSDPRDDEEYDYWDHLEWVIREAADRDLVMGILPVWADTQVGSLVTTQNAYEYGRFLGERFGDYDNIVWIMGGDAPADGVEDVWRELAEGISAGGGRRPTTYHPRGDQTSVQWFAGDDWIDFHMLQGGHCLRYEVRAKLLRKTYAAGLPFVDGEPIYEDHPYCWDQPPDGFSTALDVRRDAWWAVLGGAAGHTYGHHAVWQFLDEDRKPELGARGTWTEALDFPGARQMRHVRYLIESRPRVEPADDLVSDTGSGAERIAAAVDDNGTTVLVYTAAGREIEVDLLALRGAYAQPWWYDPRTGEATELDQVRSDGPVRFTPPSEEDWVLVVDDAEAGYPEPGKPSVAGARRSGKAAVGSSGDGDRGGDDTRATARGSGEEPTGGGQQRRTDRADEKPAGTQTTPEPRGAEKDAEPGEPPKEPPTPQVDLEARVGASGRDPGAPDPPPEGGGGDAGADTAVWDRLAECESSGNWTASTGNGYYGGLQIDLPTWRAYGGEEFAPRPDQASREQQIQVATRIRDDRGGYGSWPACARELGLPT